MGNKNRGGRPSKKDSINMEQVKKLYLAGWDDKQVADFIGVTEQTINNWKIKDHSFFESLKDWKLQADEKVERSLYERACGYKHKAIKIFQYEGKIITADYIEHYPPDTTSCIFWLKNRQPQLWRDAIKHEYDGEIKITVEALHKKVTEYAKPSGLIDAARSICIN